MSKHSNEQIGDWLKKTIEKIVSNFSGSKIWQHRYWSTLARCLTGDHLLAWLLSLGTNLTVTAGLMDSVTVKPSITRRESVLGKCRKPLQYSILEEKGVLFHQSSICSKRVREGRRGRISSPSSQDILEALSFKSSIGSWSGGYNGYWIVDLFSFIEVSLTTFLPFDESFQTIFTLIFHAVLREIYRFWPLRDLLVFSRWKCYVVKSKWCNFPWKYAKLVTLPWIVVRPWARNLMRGLILKLVDIFLFILKILK